MLDRSYLSSRPLLKELYEYFAKIEEILATLEELMNKEGLERIEKSLGDYKKKDYVTAKKISLTNILSTLKHP